MRFSRLAVLVGLLRVLCGEGAWASEPVVSDLPPEYIVQRIKEVRQGWEVVEVEFAQFEYHPAFDFPDVKSRFVARGRFVLTPPDCGELETFPVEAKGRKREDKAQDRYAWTADEFQIRLPDGHVEMVSRAELRKRKALIGASDEDGSAERPADQTKSVDREPGEKEEPVTLGSLWVQCFRSMYIASFPPLVSMMPESPKDCLPLVYADDAEALAERFELAVMENDEFFFLIASPKLLRDRRQYSNLAICLDRETFIPIAQRTVMPGGDYYSYVVTSLRVNGEDITPPAQPEKKP